MKFLVLPLLFCAAVSQTISASDSFTFKPGYPLEMGTHKGSAILSSRSPVNNQQDVFTLDICFVNKSGGDYFFNPFFNQLLPLPAQVALFDQNGNYIKDMVDRIHGSHRVIDQNSWTWIPDDSYVGAPLRVTFANIPDGKYSLQVIYYRRFVSRYQTAQSLSEHAWESNDNPDFSTSELFRSNVISVIVRDGKAKQQAEPAGAGQPVTNLLDKIPAKVQPSHPR